MFKLLVPANQIVEQKKRMAKNQPTDENNPIKPNLITTANYDWYCSIIYNFFLKNFEEFRVNNQLEFYIESSEGKEYI